MPVSRGTAHLQGNCPVSRGTACLQGDCPAAQVTDLPPGWTDGGRETEGQSHLPRTPRPRGGVDVHPQVLGLPLGPCHPQQPGKPSPEERVLQEGRALQECGATCARGRASRLSPRVGCAPLLHVPLHHPARAPAHQPHFFPEEKGWAHGCVALQGHVPRQGDSNTGVPILRTSILGSTAKRIWASSWSLLAME